MAPGDSHIEITLPGRYGFFPMFRGIDFFSDTVTRPSVAMREAMVQAEVGDEQLGEDPTTLALQDRAAELLGKTAALFFPTATMANQSALKALTQPGDELIAAENCHLFDAEAGGPAIHSQLLTRPIRTATGIFSGEEVRNAFIWSRGPHSTTSKLVSIENTANMGGGIAWTRGELASVVEAAKSLGLKMHLDGARFFNAVVRSGIPAREMAAPFDTITICLSKGLGCPVGALLVFDKSLFDSIRRLKQLFGGALRQSGMLAAAGLYALRHNVDRLEEDHRHAALLARGLSALRNIDVENPEPSTNMVFFRWRGGRHTPDEFDRACQQGGVRFSHVGPDRFRAVTHLDIRPGDIEKSLNVLNQVCAAG